MGERIRALLREDLRAAVVVAEILGRPLGLRSPPREPAAEPPPPEEPGEGG
ncbi:MAG: hypothetical protein ACP5G2_05725 [Candidatus Bipolaricaulaceae bacterium]